MLVLAAVAFAAFNGASAQKGEFHLSIQAAPQVSWLSAPDKAETDVKASGSQFGFGIGVHGDYYFSERYAITAGLVFQTNAGGTLEYNQAPFMGILDKSKLGEGGFKTVSFGKGTKVTYNNQYVEVPIGLKLHTEEVNGMRFFGNLPILTLGFRTQSQADITGDAIYLDESQSPALLTSKNVDWKKQNIGGDMSVFNLYIGGGAGVEYRLGETTTVIGGLFYQHGLIDATRNFNYQTSINSDVLTEDSNAQLSAISLRLGVMF